MNRKLNFDDLEAYLQTMSDTTKIYIGGDSEKLQSGGVWYADYTTVVVVHKDGNKGCRVFGQLERERVYDQRKDRPTMRLMTEVQKVSEMYLRIAPMLERFETQIHLDLNAKKIHASNHVVQQAIGYIRGVCGVDPQIKPDAWSASYAADRLKEIWSYQTTPPNASNILKTRRPVAQDKKRKKQSA